VKRVAAFGFAVLGAATWFGTRPIQAHSHSGPCAVGRRLVAIGDLMVFVWYPATVSAGSRRADYLPARWAAAAQPAFRRYDRFPVGAFEDAPILGGRHPLLLLLPGMGGLPTDYTFLAEDLASYGYMVAGIAPTGSSRAVVFPDGRVVQGTERVDLRHRELAQPLVDRWLRDCRNTLDYLIAEGHVNPEMIGILGHSFGGAVAMQAVIQEPRLQRGVNLDGAPQGVAGTPANKPFLLVNGAPLPPSEQALNDQILAELQSFCRSDRAGCTMEDYPESGHMNFSDAGLMPAWFPVPRSRLGITAVDPLAFLQTISTRLRLFFGPLTQS
jgi:dienelactone hydrolase